MFSNKRDLPTIQKTRSRKYRPTARILQRTLRGSKPKPLVNNIHRDHEEDKRPSSSTDPPASSAQYSDGAPPPPIMPAPAAPNNALNPLLSLHPTSLSAYLKHACFGARGINQCYYRNPSSNRDIHHYTAQFALSTRQERCSISQNKRLVYRRAIWILSSLLQPTGSETDSR